MGSVEPSLSLLGFVHNVRMSAVSMTVNFVKAKKWLHFYDRMSVFARNPGAEIES